MDMKPLAKIPAFNSAVRDIADAGLALTEIGKRISKNSALSLTVLLLHQHCLRQRYCYISAVEDSVNVTSALSEIALMQIRQRSAERLILHTYC
jgi:hypothetical protein